MARDKVELLVEIIGKDGITKLLDSAATEALRLERNMKRGEKSGNSLAKSVSGIGTNWAMVLTGLNQGLELFGKISSAAQAVTEQLKETARLRQVEARFAQQLNVSLEQMSQAAGFQLSDFELQKFALQAEQAGVSMQQFQQLLDVSLRASAATGMSFADVFEGLFVDTVVGATDSFLEQIGVVADMGTITEAYAKEMGIAKDAIDKTQQSQAMLNHVLTEVSGKFSDVNVDPFVLELGKARKAVDQFKRDFDVAFSFMAVDALDALGVTKKGVSSTFQVYKENVKEFEKVVVALQTKGLKDLDEDIKRLTLEANMKKIGRAARKSEIALIDLFDRLRHQANAMVEQAGAFFDAEQKAEAYDQALRALAKQYGVLDVAQSTYTNKAIKTKNALEDQKQIALETNRVFQTLSNTLAGGPLSEILGDDLPQAEPRDEATEEGVRALVEERKAKKRRRRGSAKKAEDEAQRFLKKAALKRSKAQRERLLSDKRFRDALEEGLRLTEKARRESQERRERHDKIREEQMIARQERELRRGGFDDEEAPLFVRQMEAQLAQEAAQMAERTQIINDSVTALREGFSETGRAVMLMGDAFGYTGERMRDMQIIAQGMEQAGESLQTITTASIEFDKNNEKVGANYAEFASTIVGAAGQAALGFVKGEKERAGILAAMEFAHAGAALATGILTGAPNAFVASAIHLANAGLYTAIASGAGGGGSRGASAGGAGRGAGGAAGAQGARRLPQFGQQMQRQDMQPAQVVVNMSGAIVAGANRRKTANDLGDLVQESMAGRR